MQHEKHFEYLGNHQEAVRSNLVAKSDVIADGIISSRQTLTTSTEQHDELATKLSALLNEMKVLVDQSRSNNQLVRNSVNDLNKVEVQIKADLSENLSSLDEFKNQIKTDNVAMTSTLGEYNAAAKNIKSNVAEMVRVSDKNEEGLVASLAEIDKSFMEHKNVLDTKVTDKFIEIENACEMTCINIEGGLNGISGDVLSEQERIGVHQYEFDETMTTLEMAQNEFHETLNADIDFCQKRLKTFHNEELKAYTPSGQTPSKRDYQFPKALATTTPHRKIVADFWETHNPDDLNCSAIISEPTKQC